MTASDDLERRIADHYAAEVPHRAPDRVLRAALVSIDTTRQRRVLGRAPWRVPTMHGFTRVAAVAVAVIAVGAVGLAVFGSGSRPATGPLPSTTPTASPTSAPIVSPTPDPSLPPPLGASFTSAVHDISLSYPTTWVVKAATKPWTVADGLDFGSPTLDRIYDPTWQDNLFLALASQPLAGKAGDTWVADLMRDPENGCGTAATQPITVDGASGRYCPDSNVVAVAAADRGYSITLYESGDEPWFSRYYDDAWFRTLLDSVQLHPAGAGRSPAPAAPGSASATPS